MNTPGKASLPVIKRLPKYYRYLRTLKTDGITSISSRELAAQMGTTASQVRQDFNCIGDVNGRQGIGYSVENLLSILEHLLFGNGDLLPTILIGCGRLGKAVSRFITTDTNGYKLIAAFDNAPDEVGKEINGIQILHIDELETFCAEHHPEVAVLCLPRSGAEEISGRLVALGDLSRADRRGDPPARPLRPPQARKKGCEAKQKRKRSSRLRLLFFCLSSGENCATLSKEYE